MPVPTFPTETVTVQSMFTHGGVTFRYTSHALSEMTKDQLLKPDVERVVRRGFISKAELNRGEWAWNIEGLDLDGGAIVAVVVAYPDDLAFKIITAWRK